MFLKLLVINYYIYSSFLIIFKTELGIYGKKIVEHMILHFNYRLVDNFILLCQNIKISYYHPPLPKSTSRYWYNYILSY